MIALKEPVRRLGNRALLVFGLVGGMPENGLTVETRCGGKPLPLKTLSMLARDFGSAGSTKRG
jgi:hypothetical protein